jgi:hypothetical protein
MGVFTVFFYPRERLQMGLRVEVFFRLALGFYSKLSLLPPVQFWVDAQFNKPRLTL